MTHQANELQDFTTLMQGALQMQSRRLALYFQK
jgi:hypothetical protein